MEAPDLRSRAKVRGSGDITTWKLPLINAAPMVIGFLGGKFGMTGSPKTIAQDHPDHAACSSKALTMGW